MAESFCPSMKKAKPEPWNFPSSLIDEVAFDHSWEWFQHIRAYRSCRGAAAAVWMEQFRLAVSLLLNTRQRYHDGKWQRDRPLWAEIQKDDWESIRKMLRAVAQHKIWAVRVGSEALPALASTNSLSEWLGYDNQIAAYLASPLIKPYMWLSSSSSSLLSDRLLDKGIGKSCS